MHGMNRIGIFALIGLFLPIGSVLAVAVRAQQARPASESSESVDIGGLRLRLGMAQDFVIHSLGEYYYLQEIGTATAAGSSWTAETKTGSPHVAVASVTFVGGLLSSVSKYWTDGGEADTGAGFATSLYGAVAKFEQENKAACEAAINSSQQPGSESRTLVVACRGRQKYLRINMNPMGNGKESVSLAEVLQYPSTKADRWFPADIDQVTPPVASGAACPLTDVLSKAGKRIQELVANVDKFAATEFVEHQSVDRSGQLRRAEIRNFTYLVSIAQTPNGYMNVEEYRNGGSNADQFPDHIATVGTPTLVLIFHPNHVKNSSMTCEGLGRWNGRPAWQVRFEERSDNRNPISVVAMGGSAFGLRLKGRAWILADSYQVARLETDLADQIPAIGLRLQHQDIEYRPVHFKEGGEIWLPSTSDLYVDFHGHRFYRRHRFTDFQLFSVNVQQTLDDLKE